MHRLRIGGVRPASVDPQIAAVHPAQFLQLLDEGSALGPSFRIAFRPAHQYADPAHPVRLLRMGGKRPSRCTADKRHELPPPHSINSSARCWRCKGTVRPRAFAVLRLIVSTYLVGACTGKLDGFSSLRT